MKKFFMTITLCLVMVLSLALAACAHEHTYAEDWSASETHHWHAATCDCEDEKSDYAEHVYTDGADTTCDTCEYEREVHQHTFASTWSSDATHHWYAATCAHDTEKDSYAQHVYTDAADTTCNTCEYEREVHQHTFASIWTTDATHHWYASTCGHDSEKSGYTEHVFSHVNDVTCNTCGYDKTAETAVAANSVATLEAALQTGGNIIVEADITSENGFIVEHDTVLNLNGHTLTVTGEKANLIKVSQNGVDLTVYGGKLVVESTNQILNGTGTSTGGSKAVYFYSRGELFMEDVEIDGSVRGGHRAIEVYYSESKVVLTNVDINTSFGNGVAAGEGAQVILNNCDITVNGMYNVPYNSTCFSVMSGAEMTINGGNYKLINDATYSTGDTHGGWVGIIMNSGGTITINDGTFTNVPADGFNPVYERAIICAQGATGVTSTINLYGGTFAPQATEVYELLDGGIMNGTVTDNGDGTWTASN